MLIWPLAQSSPGPGPKAMLIQGISLPHLGTFSDAHEGEQCVLVFTLLLGLRFWLNCIKQAEMGGLFSSR